MIDLLPAETISELRGRFGERFGALSAVERMILVTAAIERTVSHARVSTICDEHPNDLSRIIKGLVQHGFLVQSGRSRGAVYFLPGTRLPTPEVVFGDDVGVGQGTENFDQGTENGGQGSELLSEPCADGWGRAVEGLEHLLIDNLDGLDPRLIEELRAIASRTGGSGKVPSDITRGVIQDLCKGRFLTLKVLGELLNRETNSLRINILNPMFQAGLIVRAFPTTPNDRRQAYTTCAAPNATSNDS